MTDQTSFCARSIAWICSGASPCITVLLCTVVLFCAVVLLGSSIGAAAQGWGEPLANPEHNLLAVGDFANRNMAGTSWHIPDGASITFDSVARRFVLKIASDHTTYAFARQDFAITEDVTQLVISALLRFDEVVRGENSWDKARIHLTFHDRDGTQLGGWPDMAATEGSQDWAWYNHVFPVPEGSRRVSLYAGLHHASGAISIGEVIVEAKNARGETIQNRVTQHRNDTGDWLIFESLADDYLPSAIDMSHLLHKPAGKHGFVTAQDGQLVFADGTPARFLGVNIVANAAFPDKRTAELTAKRLAKYGVNLVRFHHMDAPWSTPNLFRPTSNNTKELSPESLDRLDYFIAQLKQHGIYVFMDLLVHRGFRAGDGVKDYPQIENGAKVVAHFDDHLIELQKEYATQLLTHYNPYTGLRYVDDPAIALVDIINESSLFWPEGRANIPLSYQADLEERWHLWLRDQYGDLDTAGAAWDQSPTLRDADRIRFYYDTQTRYFTEMRDHLRSIGLKVPIAGSNHWQREAADLLSNATGLDFIDRHTYWDHPQGGFGWNVAFNNQSALRDPQNSPVSGLARARVAGLPFTVSEWQHAWPNEYIAEGPLLTVAYGLLHDWSALVQFEYGGPQWARVMDGNFNIANKPHIWGQWPAVALMFHRGDVDRATTTYRFSIPQERLWSGGTFDVVPDYLPLVSRTEVDFNGGVSGGEDPDLSAALARIDWDGHRFTSDTDQLVWDGKQGVFTVDSQGTQGAVGFLGRIKQPIELSDVSIDVKTDFASLIVSALGDEASISQADRLLITAVGRAENADTVYNAVGTRLVHPGRAPILMEPIRATLLLRGRVGATVYALDSVGQRKIELPVDVTPDGVMVTIGGQAPIWYEVVFE